LAIDLTGETPFIGEVLLLLDGDLTGISLVVLVLLTRVASGRMGRLNFAGEPGLDYSLGINVVKPRVGTLGN
jgi:hypothetical protein